MMATTPRQVIDAVVGSVCGHAVEHLVRLTSGGMNETYRVELAAGGSVIARIARQPVPWFTDEAHIMAQARAVGVPTAEVLGIEHVEHDGELLSFSIQQILPGRSLDELPAADLERLVMDGGELLARVHSLVPDRGVRHELQPPDEDSLARGERIVEQTLGPSATSVVERGAAFLRRELAARPAPSQVLVHGDWVPKHLLIDDGAIIGVIDWEFAGPASPAYDFAMWEVSAGDQPHHGSELLRLGYARVTDPDAADAGWVPAFVVGWALEMLGWCNPASPAQVRRCVDVITRYADV
jgi:aminoglycoside phosphotransferase (APT) family kinase protein